MDWSWFILIALLGFAIYTLKVIRGEKKRFLELAQPFKLGSYHFKVPSWWSVKNQNDEEICFERADTRYDWSAKFKWETYVPCSSEHYLSIDKLLAERILALNLTLDSEGAIITGPDEFITHPLKQTDQQLDIIRLEGTGTQDKEYRVYYDVMMIRDPKRYEIYFLESKSSVLNGLIEGPYFEHVIMNLKMNGPGTEAAAAAEEAPHK